MELRKQIKSAVNSYWKEVGRGNDDEVTDTILDAVIAALPEVPPISHAGNAAQLNAIMGKRHYEKELLATLQSAKEQK